MSYKCFVFFMFEYEDIKPRPGLASTAELRGAASQSGPPTVHLDSDQVFCLIPALLSDK